MGYQPIPFLLLLSISHFNNHGNNGVEFIELHSLATQTSRRSSNASKRTSNLYVAGNQFSQCLKGTDYDVILKWSGLTKSYKEGVGNIGAARLVYRSKVDKDIVAILS